MLKGYQAEMGRDIFSITLYFGAFLPFICRKVKTREEESDSDMIQVELKPVSQQLLFATNNCFTSWKK